jgi:hypothetical protein
LVSVQDVGWVVAALEDLEAFERLEAEGGPNPVERFVCLHVVGVAAADRPGLDRRRRVARPCDVLVVERGAGPARHGADVEGGPAIAERGAVRFDPLRRAAQRLDQDRARRPAERPHAVDQQVDQLVGKLADEMALPVVSVDPVPGVEDPLLVQEGVAPDPVADQPRRRAQRSELLRMLVRARITGRHVQGRDQGVIDRELGLAAQFVVRPRVDIAEHPKRLADATPPRNPSDHRRPSRGDGGGR